MTDEKVIELAKQAEIFKGSYNVFSSDECNLHRFAQLVRNEAIDKRVKVKIGDQYGNDLHGHWFYLQPADEEAQKVLDNRSLKS